MADSKSKAPAAQPDEPAEPAAVREVDRVAMVSLCADGTPDQSEGFEVLIEAEGA